MTDITNRLTVPATTCFDSNLNLNVEKPVTAAMQGVDVVDLVERQLEVTHNSGEERIKEVKSASRAILDKERRIVELEALVERLKTSQEKVVLGNKAPWGQVVYAEGLNAEEIKDRVDEHYRNVLEDLREKVISLESTIEKGDARISSLRNKLEVQELKHSDAIAKLEAENASVIDEVNHNTKIEKRNFERRTVADNLDRIIELKDQRDSAIRSKRVAETEIRAERRELRNKYTELHSHVEELVKSAEKSFWFRFSGLRKRFRNLANELYNQKYTLPSWG